MTSKIVSNSKNILKPSTIKILILLSIILILILLYLKLNNKELFTSVADVNNYFRKYFATQDLYKEIQNTLDNEGQVINNLENDIRTVLSGKILPPKTTSPSEDTSGSDSSQGTTGIGSSQGTTGTCPPIPTINTTPTINCSVYYDTHIGLPNQCLSELWKGVGCTTSVSVTDNYASDGWWKRQTKKTVHDDMRAWSTLNTPIHREACYGPSATTTTAPALAGSNLSLGSGNSQCATAPTNPNIRTVRANNGTVNCNTYCRGTGGASWNNELPPAWLGAKCVGTNDIQNGCNSQVLGLRPANNPLTCECQRDDGMKYNKSPNVKTVYGNNGTVNCSTYCGGIGGRSWNNELPPEWKGAMCVGSSDPAGCSSSFLTQRTGLTCDCKQNDSTPWRN
jgi:hypothetical protein